MAVKLVSRTWKDELEKYPPLVKELGDFVRSVQEIMDKGVVPWIQMDAVSSSRVLMDMMSVLAGNGMKWIIFRPDTDISAFGDRFFRFLEFSEAGEVSIGMSYKKLMSEIRKAGMVSRKRVWQNGEFSIIGDVITLWAVGYDYPVRIEVTDNVIAKIDSVNSETRRKIDDVSKVVLSRVTMDSRKNSSADLPSQIPVWDFDIVLSGMKMESTFDQPVIISSIVLLPDELDMEFEVLRMDFRETVWRESLLTSRIKDGWSVHFVINHNIDRARQIRRKFPEVKIFEEDLSEGFESSRLKLMVLTDQELWGTVKLTSGMSKGKYSDIMLNEITPGDFVVHEDHGIGLYAGITSLDREEDAKKYLELKYAEKDRLFVPLDQVKKVTKYIGVGSKSPVLTRLRGGEWGRVKKRVEKLVQELAATLIRLYAVRALTTVCAVDVGISDLRKFEGDFEFTETDDQFKAIAEVMEDLSSKKPMDRVLVGDVGFGKTEVAMRAAFLVVRDGKQVAVLAPTTILVEQHYHVFKKRMEKYGIKVGVLSRFLGKGKIGEVVMGVKNGEIDIVIGTQRLLSKDIEFKDLGLLVIDEEQKFGVLQKEKLKGMRVDVHILSMSATPIPRTLNMALSGVRDISVIATPPVGRKSVKNIVKKFDWDTIKMAIRKEVSRGGQVYFVHNRVGSIEFVRQRLEEMLPDVRFIVGHGQLSSESLVQVMRDFNDGRYDVLICTTIIENGLDMPNVNTLIIDHAEMLGLGQLYQLRGRIGRSTRQAHAYFFYYGVGGGSVVKQGFREAGSGPSGEMLMDGSGEVSVKQKVLWNAARQRLEAIRQLEDLGSGFSLAQRDLEIRGAGNFLGKEQHGSVSAVGFSLYCRLLSEAVENLKKTGNLDVASGGRL